MADQIIKADYLVVGAGAMGLAFADMLLNSSDASIAIVDRLGAPGGHWNHAYPFVRLHQPSYFYGVNSKEIGENRTDLSGRNKGMLELASGAEVLSYFDNLLRQEMLPTGRVQYFPQCEYTGNRCFRSIASGVRYRADVGKTVDATYMNVKVPKVTPPPFSVAPGVEVIPPNELTSLTGTFETFVIVGAGKTAFDACLYMLDMGVAPEQILWIKPRESWLFDRAQAQPEEFGGVGFSGIVLEQAQIVAESTSFDDMFARLERCGALLRIDTSVTPTMYRCATISQAELSDLRKITNVIRKGRVVSLEAGLITLEGGEHRCPASSLFVNCTADGLERRPAVPVFDGAQITLQAVRPCQQLFSAALIGYIETTQMQDARKNELCVPTPHPDSNTDYLHFLNALVHAQLRWVEDPDLFNWLLNSRLDAITTDSMMAILEGNGALTVEEMMNVLHSASAKADAYLAELGNRRIVPA
ncbi:MAG: NAD(P)/FAD-dependent oxidoreductase [Pseudomonadota bacterium]